MSEHKGILITENYTDFKNFIRSAQRYQESINHKKTCITFEIQKSNITNIQKNFGTDILKTDNKIKLINEFKLYLDSAVYLIERGLTFRGRDKKTVNPAISFISKFIKKRENIIINKYYNFSINNGKIQNKIIKIIHDISMDLLIREIKKNRFSKFNS
ncbi:hypothetical protein DMUE_5186 [Dictyocoela muelleri]|nr:hypothetical protein DMUE_5186 [Dictyocoela muelleri]